MSRTSWSPSINILFVTEDAFEFPHDDPSYGFNDDILVDQVIDEAREAVEMVLGRWRSDPRITQVELL